MIKRLVKDNREYQKRRVVFLIIVKCFGSN